jgi:hypothetical protein
MRVGGGCEEMGYVSSFFAASNAVSSFFSASGGSFFLLPSPQAHPYMRNFLLNVK